METTQQTIGADHRSAAAREREEDDVLTQLFVWANMAMDGVEIAALGAVLFVLFHMRRDLSAMLRVLRRMDRKRADAMASIYGPQQR
jgi:hypothetical protein